MARATASCSTCSDGDCRSRFFRPRLTHAWGLWPQVCTGMTWETPFPRSRMPASFEKFIKALHCLQCRAKAILTPSPAHAQSLHAPGSAAEVRRSDGSAQMGYESPAPACAVATRAEVSLSGPASCSCSSRARSSGAALPPLELRRAWHARGRWPPAEVGRAGARWQGMQAGGGAGRQAGASARKNGARICPCRRRPRCRVVDGCGTAAGAGIRLQLRPTPPPPQRERREEGPRSATADAATATPRCHRRPLQLSVVAAALQRLYFSSTPPTTTSPCLIANLSPAPPLPSAPLPSSTLRPAGTRVAQAARAAPLQSLPPSSLHQRRH